MDKVKRHLYTCTVDLILFKEANSPKNSVVVLLINRKISDPLLWQSINYPVFNCILMVLMKVLAG